ncbi:MAG: type II toxin-antitoxin system HicA family toxin [Armatimonadota bacterium]
MGKLRVLSGREVCGILSTNGFIEVRQRGSHVAMQKALNGTTITVPVPLHKELRTGTLLSIIRQSGLSKSLFEE